MHHRAAIAILLFSGCSASSDAAGELDAPRLALVEELRLDPIAEDFSVVPGIGVGPRGQIAVLQPQDGQVRLYDSTGARIATIGRRGSGPGEFRFPGRAGWVGDTMWVVDVQLRRMVFVAPDGSVLRTSALPGSVGPGAPLDGDSLRMGFFLPIGVHPDGSLVGEAHMEAVDTGARTRELETVFVRVPDDTLPRIVWAPPARDEQWRMRVDAFWRPVPFAPTPQWDIAQDVSRSASLTMEFADAMDGTMTLTVVGMNGDTTLVRSYPFQGIPIPAGVRDSVLASLAAQKARQREGPSNLYDRYQEIAAERMPAAYPPVLGVTVGLDETTWLVLRDSGDVRRVLVLDGEGEPIGTFELPRRATLRRGVKGRVWVTQRDDDDLASVVRYRLEPARALDNTGPGR